jgi:hypothetical protein
MRTLMSEGHLGQRLRAAGIHLCVSAAVAALAALVVFGLWYPYPYREISGGRELFVLLTSVDVVIGPLITLAVFNLAKQRKVLQRDLAVIGLLQIAALAYGLWTVAAARPVHLVFEIYRFRVVHAVEVRKELVPKAPAGIDVFPWGGPTLLSLRPFRDSQERGDAARAAFEGVQMADRPDFWQGYDLGRKDVIAAAKPLSQLLARRPADSQPIAAAVRELGRAPADIGYVPLVSRQIAWTVLVDPKTADVLSFLPIDAF